MHTCISHDNPPSQGHILGIDLPPTQKIVLYVSLKSAKAKEAISTPTVKRRSITTLNTVIVKETSSAHQITDWSCDRGCANNLQNRPVSQKTFIAIESHRHIEFDKERSQRALTKQEVDRAGKEYLEMICTPMIDNKNQGTCRTIVWCWQNRYYFEKLTSSKARHVLSVTLVT